MENDIDLQALAWAWPVRDTFVVCPLLGVLWCAALERYKLASHELGLALRLIETLRQLNERRDAPS